MCIVIYDGDIIDRSLVFKTAVRSGEGKQTFLDRIHGKSQQLGCCDRGKGVGHIVISGHGKDDVCVQLSVSEEIKCNPTFFIVGDILRTVVKFWRHSVSHHAAVQTFADFLILIDLSVNDQCSVRWQQGCKLMKGVTDIFQIFKEIQMIGFNVQDDADLREKVQEAVCIFTGLCDEDAGASDPDISADGLQNPAHRDGRICVTCQQNMRDHGSCCRLAMSS